MHARRDERTRLTAAVVTAAAASLLAGCGSGGDAAPAKSRAPARPADGRIAFVAGPAGPYAIWLVQPDGRGLAKLTTASRQRVETAPAWSPGGERVVFAGYEDADADPVAYGVYVVRADGSGLRKLYGGRAAGSAEEPAWSPDGRRIAFVGTDAEGRTGISVVAATGSEPAAVTRPQDASDHRPAWSPDGRRIAFERWLPDGNVDLYSVAPDGSDLRRLTDGAGAETEPAWSPDGASIAFVAERGGDAAIHVAGADGAGDRPISDPPGTAVAAPAWSPDGTKVAFQVFRGESWDVVVASVDGGEIVLAGGPGDEVSPAWSPDGTTVAFERTGAGPAGRDNAGSFDVYVVRSDGTGETRLTRGVAALGHGLSWQPSPASG